MLSEYEAYLLDKIDSRVEHATDDELFAGGYLQGHIT
ncbi:YfcL family protein, partial [Vibrio cholerae]